MTRPIKLGTTKTGKKEKSKEKKTVVSQKAHEAVSGRLKTGTTETPAVETVRHSRPVRTPEEIDRGITSSDIKRMCRRAGIERLASDIYGQARKSLREFLKEIIKDAVLYMENTRGEVDEATARTGGTVSSKHVVAALKNNGMVVWGLE